MWHLVNSELIGRSLYRSQKIYFMRSAKALVKAVYHRGQKATSAFFSSNTKPIFRSESSRVTIFVQMSKEMWDFDANGAGELILHHAIDGFLPELFSRWQEIGARHQISIILFTRMQYEKASPPLDEENAERPQRQSTVSIDPPYRDFFKVLAEAASVNEAYAGLRHLKAQCKAFLKDVSLQTTFIENSLSKGFQTAGSLHKDPRDVVWGQPAPATHGNTLEAINMACTQFAHEVSDPRLMHTGFSVIVITPGTGVFKMSSDLVRSSTDMISRTGASVHLVCLSSVPLHCVPLLGYQASSLLFQSEASPSVRGVTGYSSDTLPASDAPEYENRPHSGLSTPSETPPEVSSRSSDVLGSWTYVIPHWMDISFWPSVDAQRRLVRGRYQYPTSGGRAFVPRAKIYEVQMMGIMENEISSVSMPRLYLCRLPPTGTSDQTQYSRWSAQKEATFQHSKSFDGTFTDVIVAFPEIWQLSPDFLTKLHDSLLEMMDAYDDRVFSTEVGCAASLLSSRCRQAPAISGRQQQKSQTTFQRSWADESSFRPSSEAVNKAGKSSRAPAETQSSHEADQSRTSRAITKSMREHPVQISQRRLGFRGFAPRASKADSIAELSSETVYPKADTRSHGAIHNPSNPHGEGVQLREAATDFSEPSSMRIHHERTSLSPQKGISGSISPATKPTTARLGPAITTEASGRSRGKETLPRLEGLYRRHASTRCIEGAKDL